jgi:ubiquinone/menaquinone biosynthesis C-methylase UbiE
MDPTKLWFNTPETDTLCRGGTNGPAHPTQIYAIEKYVDTGMSFLDYGCGSGTTLEAIINYSKDKNDFSLDYTGTDVIPKNIEWDKKQWPDFKFVLNTKVNKITQPDKSFDVVFSRHVVDHMECFDCAVDEHCRVAKELVIIILWYSLNEGEEDIIKNIDYRHEPNGKLYPTEFLNSYSRKKVKKYLENKEGWEVIEFTEHLGTESPTGGDTVICLKRKS